MVIYANEVETKENKNYLRSKINYNIDVDIAYLCDFVTKFGYAITQVLIA